MEHVPCFIHKEDVEAVGEEGGGGGGLTSPKSNFGIFVFAVSKLYQHTLFPLILIFIELEGNQLIK